MICAQNTDIVHEIIQILLASCRTYITRVFLESWWCIIFMLNICIPCTYSDLKKGVPFCAKITSDSAQIYQKQGAKIRMGLAPDLNQLNVRLANKYYLHSTVCVCKYGQAIMSQSVCYRSPSRCPSIDNIFCLLSKCFASITRHTTLPCHHLPLEHL